MQGAQSSSGQDFAGGTDARDPPFSPFEGIARAYRLGTFGGGPCLAARGAVPLRSARFTALNALVDLRSV